MKRVVLLVMVAIVALVFSAPTFAQDAAKIAQGEKVYAREKCSICHAIAGKGNKKLTLDGVGKKLTADAIREWMVSPKTAAAKAKSTATPAMKAYEKLSKEDLDAVVAYMLSLKS
jgi:mono/diheme cytochrome c family protein